MDIGESEQADERDKYAVYIQHVTQKGWRKTVNAKTLLNLKGRDFWKFKPKHVRDYKKLTDYGRHEGDTMVQYFIIHMTGEFPRMYTYIVHQFVPDGFRL